MATSETQLEPIQLVRIFPETIQVTIEGTAPLIVNQWTQKAKQQIIDKNQGKTRVKQDPKEDAEVEFEQSRYRIDSERDGFPAVAFKAAIINAVTLFEGITKVAIKQALSVIGEGPSQLVEIISDGPTMRQDYVRFGMSSTDIRHRASYFPWAVDLQIRYIPEIITPSSVVALVDAGGNGGVGEWRPSAPKSLTGTFGTFKVST